jgi:hypothetical protein
MRNSCLGIRGSGFLDSSRMMALAANEGGSNG